MRLKKLTLLVAMLAMVLVLCAPALSQTMPGSDTNPSPDLEANQTVDQPATQQQDPAAQQQEPATQLSCEDIFRAEQIELAQTGVYPTSVSDQARACEESGAFNPHPAPYFYDTEGFLYTYDPINARYTSEYDPVAGVYYIYDLVSHAFYTYDPASGTFV